MRRLIKKIDGKKLLFFLSIMGPGLITANVDNDAAGITTYSVAGSHYGYALLWSFIPMVFLLIIVQEMVARLGVVTGKGLSDLIREEYGVKTTVFVMAALLITNLGTCAAEFAGLAASLEIFGVSRYVTVPIACVVIWFLVVHGNYRTVEKVFLGACIIYFSYILSGFMAKPDWGEVARHTVYPTFYMNAAFIGLLIGMVGTTISPWMQFYQQASIVEKQVRIEDYTYVRWDVILGCLMASTVAFFIVVACGATLHINNILIHTAEDAAMALTPLAGGFANILFAIGLTNASLFAATILPLSTTYTICEGMGWEAGVNKTFQEAPQFMGLYTGLIILSGGFILIPGAPLIKIMLVSQVINGILLPFVLIFILLLVNKKRLMGPYVNGRFSNGIAWGAVVILVFLSGALIVDVIRQVLA
ncbi:MAG: family manganese transport rane protein [Deltaproteobacteria bacterium]|nr:family manganese transport rane protein [Deltaproteobacteria bacterium]